MMNKLITILLIFTTCFARDKKVETSYDKVWDLNARFFKNHNDHFSTYSTVEHFKTVINRELNPKANYKRYTAFDLLASYEEKHTQDQENIIDSTTWQDLALFCNNQREKEYFANRVDRTQTELGKVFLYKTLAYPISNVDELVRRQDAEKHLVENQELFISIKKELNTISKNENLLLAFWSDWDGFEHSFRNKKFTTFSQLNSSESALLFKSALDHTKRASGYISAVFTVFAISAYIASRPDFIQEKIPDKFKNFLEESYQQYKSWGIPFSSYVAQFFEKLPVGKEGIASLAAFSAFSAIPNIHDYTKGMFLLDKFLQLKLIKVSNIIRAIREINNEINKSPKFRDKAPSSKVINDFFNSDDPKIQKFLSLIESNTFTSEASFVQHTGKVVLTYDLIYQLKDKLEGVLVALAEIDMYMSVATLIQEGSDTNYSFAQYIQNSERPVINLQGFWHPFISLSDVVKNSIHLGVNGVNMRSNAVVTGPNAAGKSTILRAIVTSLIMAQTLGVAPAHTMSFTPFINISTYLNVIDDIAEGNSLFKSEVLRAQRIIEKNNNLKKGEFSFLVMDEIFSGTSPIEGEAAAFGVAKSIGKFDKSICMIATHFPLLTKLEKQTNYFNNYKVSVIKENGKIKYPFKLQRGISKQNVALDILRDEGFEGEVVNLAQSIVNKK